MVVYPLIKGKDYFQYLICLTSNNTAQVNKYITHKDTELYTSFCWEI